ncbi:hypothetical protein EJ08DRAFT_485473 [Tothia fuscella]|uniref:Uncharacterized protein n=1 Tax=Tothia fuscella TaxID=1048955 RepID=A0A9P4NHT4_9PEZI|nr:hypothetical protein EJ08DRAFT_485473 [Tothia fuscella]
MMKLREFGSQLQSFQAHAINSLRVNVIPFPGSLEDRHDLLFMRPSHISLVTSFIGFWHLSLNVVDVDKNPYISPDQMLRFMLQDRTSALAIFRRWPLKMVEITLQGLDVGFGATAEREAWTELGAKNILKPWNEAEFQATAGEYVAGFKGDLQLLQRQREIVGARGQDCEPLVDIALEIKGVLKNYEEVIKASLALEEEGHLDNQAVEMYRNVEAKWLGRCLLGV